MVDTLMFYFLALALSLAQPSESQLRIDFMNPAEGRIETLVATRTDDGWRVGREDNGEAALFAKNQGGEFEFVIPDQKDAIKVSLGDAATTLAGCTERLSLTLGGQEYVVIPSGDMTYLMAKGRGECAAVRRMGSPALVQATGTLRYRKVEPAMTPEAYQGIEFTLEREGQDSLALSPSDAVSHDALVALDGKRVDVGGVMTKGRDPLPGEAYPMGPDGKPLPRVDRLEVRSVRESAK